MKTINRMLNEKAKEKIPELSVQFRPMIESMLGRDEANVGMSQEDYLESIIEADIECPGRRAVLLMNRAVPPLAGKPGHQRSPRTDSRLSLCLHVPVPVATPGRGRGRGKLPSREVQELALLASIDPYRQPRTGPDQKRDEECPRHVKPAPRI